MAGEEHEDPRDQQDRERASEAHWQAAEAEAEAEGTASEGTPERREVEEEEDYAARPPESLPPNVSDR